jgi:signal transduction histidine kinase
MRKLGWHSVAFTFGTALLGSAAQCLLPATMRSWGDVLPNLYYIPIVISGISLNSRATISVALASGAAYGLTSALGFGDPWIRPLTETMLFVCVGITARLTVAHNITTWARQGISKYGNQALEDAFHEVQSARQIPALSQVVAGLIHRFRTPVSSIEGAVWLLDEHRSSEDKHQEFVRIIQKESHQLDRALSDALNFTQPERPKLRKVDLNRLLDEVIELAGPKDHGPYFLFRKEIPPVLAPLNCDPALITKLLLNLLMNSIQATPGGGQISIAARTGPGVLVVSVKDQGRGIAQDIIGRIFDPFFTTRDSGLGLGLTVARQIAVSHGGTIDVDYSSDKGTSVSVTLPLNSANAHDHGPNTGG